MTTKPGPRAQVAPVERERPFALGRAAGVPGTISDIGADSRLPSASASSSAGFGHASTRAAPMPRTERLRLLLASALARTRKLDVPHHPAQYGADVLHLTSPRRSQ